MSKNLGGMTYVMKQGMEFIISKFKCLSTLDIDTYATKQENEFLMTNF